MFSAYFVFHCLNMFCVEKQVSEFFATQLMARQLQVYPEALATHSRLAKISPTEPRDLPNCKTPRNSFLKSFFMRNLF